MIVRVLIVSMMLFLAACSVQDFPSERKVNVDAGAGDRVVLE